MKIYRGLGDVPSDFGPSAVTIGKFDGVHLGHRAVIRELLEVAEERQLTSTVMTFDRHPMRLFKPERAPVPLVGVEQKLQLLAKTGVDSALLVTFDEDFAELSPEQFVTEILVKTLRAEVVLVGHDFRFGAHGSGSAEDLRALGLREGFEVRLIDDVRPGSGRRVSSTWVRELLAEGDVENAAVLLGHAPAVQGEVVHGAKRGRDLGFPTANLSPLSQGLIPADGVYAGWLIDGDTRYPAAISVGSNPTFVGVPPKQVEAYVIDHEGLDLYGHVVTVSFTHRIRGMVKFDGIERLIAQMNADVDRARELLSAANEPPLGIA